MHRPSLEELRQLSVEDRLQLLDDIWSTFDDDPHPLPIPKWQEEELERRLKAFEDNPDAGSPWPEVKKRLLERG